ncbi:MAG: hypothetical protein HDR88_12665 [Bacteroides sp.]|nr:hypothetical protein [Bacteroides sp.]
MRKSTILIAAALLSGQAVASVLPENPVSQWQGEEIASGKIVKQTPRLAPAAKKPMKASANSVTYDTPTPPNVKNEKVYSEWNENVFGEKYSQLYKSAKGYQMGIWMPSAFDVSGVVGEYVLDRENGEIYIYNPITLYRSYSYIKGSVDAEGNVTVECPQLIACSSEEDLDEWAYYVMNSRLNDEGYSYEPVPDDFDLHFTLGEDGTLTLCENQKIGLYEYVPFEYYDYDEDQYVEVPGKYCYDWLQYSDNAQSMHIFTEVGVKPDTELEVEPWVIAYRGVDYYSEYFTGYSTQTINACIDGDTFWVKGIIKSDPNCWFKGEINGDEVTFNTSFICFDEPNGYFQYLLAGNMYEDEVEASLYFDFSNSVTLSIDREKKVITSREGQTLMVNAGKESVYYLYRWINPVMKPEMADAAPAKPLAPLFGSYFPMEDGYDAYFSFCVSALDVNYNPLDTDGLFYEILIDGEPYEFDMDELDPYDGGEGTEEIFPWDYDSYNLFAEDTERILYHSFDGYDTIGARVLFITEEGDYLYSDPMIYDVQSGTVGIEKVTENHGEVVATVFTSLDGVRVSRPAKGIYIKTTVYADGTRSVRKVIRK